MSLESENRAADAAHARGTDGGASAGKRSLTQSMTTGRALVQRAGGDGGGLTIHDAATVAVEHKDGGQPVDGDVAARVGGHLGADFSGVRVHQDDLAQGATAAMGARAFAYGGDVFLGPGESGADLGLMAHELTHVAQQGAAGQRALQRQVQVGDAGTPAEREADQVAADVTGGSGRPAQLIVDDGPVQPGQMLKSAFLEQLRAQVSDAAADELGPLGSVIGCPFIDQHFGRYAGQPAATGEAMLRRYAPSTRSARSAAEMIPAVVARVREGVRTWRETGQPPADIAAAEPGAAAAAAPAVPAAGAAALRAPDGAETLGSLEAGLGAGQPLDAGTAARMSSALDADLSSVRIHTGAAAAAKAAEVGAMAFAAGRNVVLGAGAPAAGTLEGDALLAHELAHTVQQRDAAAAPEAQRAPIGGESSAAEDDADAAAAGAAAALHGGVREAGEKKGMLARLGAALRSGVQLQRCGGKPDWAPEMPAGTNAPTNGRTFSTGAEIDGYFSASPTLSPYVGARITGGEVSTGHIHFHSTAEFETAYMSYAAGKTNPATGSAYTEDEARAAAAGIAGFRDVNELHIDQEKAQPTDTIHESVHRYQDSAYPRAVGHAAKEGTTEYFTQRVCSEQTPPLARTDPYPSETGAVTRMIGTTGVAPVAEAFFNGNISGLRTAVDAGSAGRFDQWTGFMNRATPDYTSANALF